MPEFKLTKRSTADRLRYIVDHVSNFEVTMPIMLREIADEIDTIQARSDMLVRVCKAWFPYIESCNYESDHMTKLRSNLTNAMIKAQDLLTPEEKADV